MTKNSIWQQTINNSEGFVVVLVLWRFVVEIVGTCVEVICIIIHYVNKTPSGREPFRTCLFYEDVELGQHPCMGRAGPLYLWVNNESDHFQKLQRYFLHFVSL